MVWFDIPDELLPPAYREIKDVYAYARTLDTELRNYLVTAYYIRNNFFIQTCDQATLEQWIALLQIPLYGGESIEDKRELVLLYLNNQKPSTEAYFRSMMDVLFGPDGYYLRFDEQDPLRLDIGFIDQSPIQINQFADWFVRMVPAHILWDSALIEPSESMVYMTENCILADKMRMTASCSMGSDATLYNGSTPESADWMIL